VKNEYTVHGSIGGKILIVDDKPENLRLLIGIVKEAGYIVRQLRNGKNGTEPSRWTLSDG